MLSPQSEIVSTAVGPTGQSGAIVSVSSNGSQVGTGILWAAYAASGDAEHDVRPGVLRAFDANDVSNELWNNQLAPRDGAGAYAKFAAPTIANGHVYLPTFSNSVVVYGLR
jgi:outer membrane protein assembly factor BamB